jgi:Uncharacterised nucleotidyltransferase
VPETSLFAAGFPEKEWPFLCACVSPVSEPERIRSLVTSDVNWDTVLLLAEEHGVQGMLAKRLEQVEFAGVLAATRQKLQAQMRAQHLFTLSMTAELFRILQDFSKADIDCIAVKGPVISQLAYGDPALRSYGDLDFLVRHKDVQVAVQRLLAMGFEPDLPAHVIQSDKVPGEYLFRRMGTAHLVELHTQQTFRHYPEPMRIDEMIARKRRVLLEGRDVPALSLEDEVVFDCVHGGKDFWERLMWVSDVAAILVRHSEIDWEKTRRGAAEVGAGRMLRTGVLLASTVFGMKLPGGIAHEIERDRDSRALCDDIQKWLPYAGSKEPSIAKRAIYRMRLAGGGLSGIKYLTRLSLSPTEDDWEHSGAAGSWLWEAARRPLRLIRKYGSEQ